MKVFSVNLPDVIGMKKAASAAYSSSGSGSTNPSVRRPFSASRTF
jgi:hypothetical protein